MHLKDNKDNNIKTRPMNNSQSPLRIFVIALLSFLESLSKINKSMVFKALTFVCLFLYSSVAYSQGPKVIVVSAVIPPAGPQDFQRTWVAPGCVTTVTVEVWGAGGSGFAGTGNNSNGGGGGGGAYSRAVLTVVPGDTYDIQIGMPGVDGALGQSWFGSATTVMAEGGLNCY